MISCSMPTGIESPQRPFLVRTTFDIGSTAMGRHARVCVTAYGVYELEINGRRVGDQVLAPGWTVYEHLVGWLRLEGHPPGQAGHIVTFTHAEVLENDELGTRPLRIAKCRDEITLGNSSLVGWEPKFTYHGFRYVQVDGCQPKLEDLVAVVIQTDMERLGHFESSHEQINQLHRNVVWGLRGNFVSIPTDCPQRDERLGWTGDLAIFARTAGFLYDTTDMLGSWLEDVAAEQLCDNDGVPSLATQTVCVTSILPYRLPSGAMSSSSLRAICTGTVGT